MTEKKSISKKENPFENFLTLLVVAAACVGIIYFSIYPKPSLALSGGIVAIICALSGVWITVVVTRLLLSRQSEAQAKLQNEQLTLQQECQQKLLEQQQECQQKLLDNRYRYIHIC